MTISKRDKELEVLASSTVQFGWWISPNGEAYDVSREGGHWKFIDNHPELFGAGHDAVKNSSWEAGFEKGWVRAVKQQNFVSLDIPGVLSNDRFKTIKSTVLKEIEGRSRVDFVALYFDKTQIFVPFNKFVELENLNDLKKAASVMYLAKKRAKVVSDKPAYEKKEKGDAGPIYRYGPEHLKLREKDKKNKLKKIETNIEKLRKQYEKDLSSDDMRVAAEAAIIGIIDDTAMRIGNPDSVKKFDTYGATTLKVKHLTISGNKSRFKFVGKDQVKQDVETNNPKIAKVLKELIKGKKSDDFIFEIDGVRVWDRAINRALSKFNISAKDIRGFLANKLMKDMLKKKDWKEALEEVADIVGHEPATLKNQYLDPDLVAKYETKKKASYLSPRDFEYIKENKISHRAADILKSLPGEKEITDRYMSGKIMASEEPKIRIEWVLKASDDSFIGFVQKSEFDNGVWKYEKEGTMTVEDQDSIFVAQKIFDYLNGPEYSEKISQQIINEEKLKKSLNCKKHTISKRSALTPEDAAFLQQVGVGRKIQTQTQTQQAPQGIQPNVKTNMLIFNAWRMLRPFLPRGSKMTSGFRTPEDQKRILMSYWNKAGLDQNDYGYGDFNAMSRILKDYGYIVNPPNIKGEYGHTKGNAFDISGADLNEISEAVRKVSNMPEFKINLSALPEEKNNCVHVTIYDAKYDPVALSKALQERQTEFSADDKAYNEEETVLKDLLASDAPDEIKQIFSKEQLADDKPKVVFSADEQKLIDLLKDVVKYYNLDVELRIVGGFVRDALLKNK